MSIRARRRAVQEHSDASNGSARLGQDRHEQVPDMRHAPPYLQLDVAPGCTKPIGDADRIVSQNFVASSLNQRRLRRARPIARARTSHASKNFVPNQRGRGPPRANEPTQPLSLIAGLFECLAASGTEPACVRFQTVRHRLIVLILHVTAKPEHIGSTGALLLQIAPMTFSAQILGMDGDRREAQ
jgi:hypothetical protein